MAWSTRIKDAGIVIRHSQGRILFYTAGSRHELQRVAGDGPGHKTLRKRHVFVIEKHIEDVKQDEKHVPDLLEPIMRLTLFVKEELWLILFKLSQFGSNISKLEVSTFWMCGKSTNSRRRPMPAFSLVSFKQSRPFPCNIWPR